MSKKSNSSEPRKRASVNIDDPLFAMFFTFFKYEIGFSRPFSTQAMLEWFYRAEKGSEYVNSTYSQPENRDDRAYRATETFRKTFLKPGAKAFTPEFLASIVRKIRSIGQVSSWDEFVVSMEPQLLSFIQDNPDKYDWYLKHEAKKESMSKDIFYAVVLAQALYRVSMIHGEVFIYNNDLTPAYTVIGIGGINVIIQALPDMFRSIDAFEKSQLLGSKLVNYSKRLLYKKNAKLFFVSIDNAVASPDFVTAAFGVIPLNETGMNALQNGELLFSTISPDMVCAPVEMKSIKAVYLDIYVSYTNRIFMESCLNPLLMYLRIGKNKNIMIYISNDTNEKLQIIATYSMKRISFKRKATVTLQKRRYHPPTTQQFEYSIYGIKLMDMTPSIPTYY